MPSTATVAQRPRARCAARLPPARSICESSQPPKISPFGFASAGIAITRTSGMVCGNLGEDNAGSTFGPMVFSEPRSVSQGTLLCGMPYLYSALSWVLGPDQSEAAMLVRAKQNWCRRAAFAGAVLATAVLTLGATPQPVA